MQRKLGALSSLFCLEGKKPQLFSFVRTILIRKHVRLGQEGMFQVMPSSPCSIGSKQVV